MFSEHRLGVQYVPGAGGAGGGWTEQDSLSGSQQKKQAQTGLNKGGSSVVHVIKKSKETLASGIV